MAYNLCDNRSMDTLQTWRIKMTYEILLKEGERAAMILNRRGDYIHVDFKTEESFRDFEKFIIGGDI